MVNCPKCGRPLTGTARFCGYCGQSLVEDYFSKEKAENTYPEVGAANIAATVLGIFGSIAVLVALLFQILLLFGIGGERLPQDAIDTLWWVRTVSMAVAPIIFLIQQIMHKGARFSLWFDGIWLFLATAGLSFTVQAYADAGAQAFYGTVAVAYLLAVGCGVACIACITGIFSYRSM